MYCLLPVWPLQLKIFIWWVSYILLNIMVGICLIRYSLYLFVLIFGKEFWLFPDLFDYHKGIVDSFFPLISFENNAIDLISVVKRLSLATFVVYSAYNLYME